MKPVISAKSPGIRLLSIHKTISDNMALHFSQRGISSPRTATGIFELNRGSQEKKAWFEENASKNRDKKK
ncbi:hypothetical protein DNTS_025277 [Danionella cerebrum]|uniref:Uncharacterized protein n=1 Tax=Danionella cerebrum TaxID=2873325 RepID=A0A553RJE5_9TELE|nr:hypothetical protein DNTS_025277 [Danionella translucida]TRZ02297.1 hypothetical protein DNTS_025277 [Danionella translucida]